MEQIAVAWPDYKTLAWHKVTGPLRAVVRTLADVGWEPTSSNAWTDPAGDLWKMTGDTVDLRQLSDAFTHFLQQDLWRKAALGHLGGGLEHGADMRAVHRKLSSLRAKGDHQAAGLCLCLAAAGMWPNQRVASVGHGSPLCSM